MGSFITNFTEAMDRFSRLSVNEMDGFSKLCAFVSGRPFTRAEGFLIGAFLAKRRPSRSNYLGNDKFTSRAFPV